MIDRTTETLILLSKAALIINPTSPPHVATVWRWTGHGVSGITLESIKLGGSRYTSREAIERFIQRLNGSEKGQEE